jgi:NAD(P)-dependent dehydrogenase (short-subunit alcohol dehydrogenase family)
MRIHGLALSCGFMSDAVERGMPKSKGIRVNVICPGAIGTNIGENTASRNIEPIRIPVEYPAGRRIPLTDKRGSPAEVAELVLFLATDRSRHMTGTEMYIDGAESLL